MSLYALRTPKRRIIGTTISDTIEGCWDNSFNYVATELGVMWARRYWKRWKPSLKSAIKNGYQIIEVKIVRVNR